MPWLRVRALTSAELAIQIMIGLWFALLLWDFVTASGATGCGDRQASPNCYPWSVEGQGFLPWHYRDKQTYLRSSVGEMIVCIGAILAPFVTGSRWRGIASSLSILVVGTLTVRLFASQL
jgi:hypothetical protein